MNSSFYPEEQIKNEVQILGWYLKLYLLFHKYFVTQFDNFKSGNMQDSSPKVIDINHLKCDQLSNITI